MTQSTLNPCASGGTGKSIQGRWKLRKRRGINSQLPVEIHHYSTVVLMMVVVTFFPNETVMVNGSMNHVLHALFFLKVEIAHAHQFHSLGQDLR